MANTNALNIGVTAGNNNNYYFPTSSGTLALTHKNIVNATASRALATTYANGGTSALLCMVSVRCAITLAAGSAWVQAVADNAGPPTAIASGIIGIQNGLLSEDNSFLCMFVVGTSLNYRVDTINSNGSTTLGSWFEVQL